MKYTIRLWDDGASSFVSIEAATLADAVEEAKRQCALFCEAGDESAGWDVVPTNDELRMEPLATDYLVPAKGA